MLKEFTLQERVIGALALVIALLVIALFLLAMYHIDSVGQLQVTNGQLWTRVQELERKLWETEQARLACGQGWYETMEALNYALSRGVK